MEDVRTALNLLEKHIYMCRLDLKDAYLLVPMDSDHTKFLRFEYQNCLYQFLTLPFGLCSAPFAFTKIIKPVSSYLRERGIRLVTYLDDFLILGDSVESCEQDCARVADLLTELGFIINWGKSEIKPTQEITFLGFTINSITMRIGLPCEKRRKMKNTCYPRLEEKKSNSVS